MKQLYSLFFTIILFNYSFSQTADQYSFSASSGSYSTISGSNINGIEDDDALSGAKNIGFTFNYCGTDYTQFKVSSNGWLTFNTSETGSLTINDLDGTSTPQDRLAPLWDDLDGRASSTSVAKYKTTGSAGSQILTVEWRNWEWNYSAGDGVISFQVKLYESDNHIEFVYRRESNSVNSGSASIGIQDAAGNFQSLDGTGGSPTASSATETTSLSSKPANDQVYSWTPPSGPMLFSSCTTTQNNTDNVGTSSTNNEIIGIEIVTTGYNPTIDATSFTFKTNGTDDVNDIENATLWSTGTSSTFATTTQVGSVVSNPNGTFTINGTSTLLSGTNYFWLTYDITSGATLGNIVDARCTSVTVDGTAHTPSTTNPTGNRLIDYCTNTNTSNTSYYIDDFSTTNGSVNITNNNSGFSTNGYGDFTAMTVHQEQGGSVNFSIAESGGSMKFGIWIDWNQDGDFEDSDENVYINNSYNTSVSGSFSVPTSAIVGDTRMRVVGKELGSNDIEACTGTSYTECEDYTFHVNVGTPITYSSSTTTQNNTTNVETSSVNNEVIGIEIVTTGYLTAIDATSFTFNTTGTDDAVNDITNATLWSTGTNSSFATTTQMGSIVSNPNGTFTIDGTVALSNGTNYFWLTYDVPSGASIDNVIDAECTSLTVDGTVYTPSTTAPAGDRLIDYCTFSNSSSSYYIDDFSTTGGTSNITNNNSGFATNGYGDYTAMLVAQEQGGSIDFSAATQGSNGLAIFIDWNQDGDFNDTGEDVYVGGYATAFSGTITVPTNATIGTTRMRIVTDYYDSTPEACDNANDEVEDYTFQVNVGTPMSISSLVTTQNNTTDFYKGLSNVEVIGLTVSTTGYLSPISVSEFLFNTNGTTDINDIQNAKLWTTGSSSTFATTTQVGNIYGTPNGSFSFSSGSNLPYELENGDNYFWITYDVPSSATTGNYIDAECSSIIVNGTSHVPSTIAPTGRRKIIVPPDFDGTFESSNNFSGNGMTNVAPAKNYWKVGTATDNGGSHSAYVTKNGSANNYDNGTSSYAHFYFDYLFPAGETMISLSFDWKCDGEGSWDNVQVFLEPTSETPTAGSSNNSSYRIGSSYYSENTSWQTVTISIDASYAGTLQRVVFQWKNDGSGGDNPPAAIDNIIIDTHVPMAPDCAENLSPIDGATDVCNATVNLTWDAPSTGDPQEGYYIYLGTDNPPTNIENGTNIGDVTSYDPGTITASSTYYWQIVPYNSGGSASSCSVYSFTTGNGQSNDLPCNAEAITLGSTASGNNDCTSNDSEPGKPSCWTSGTRNTVWYSFVAPAGGNVDIATGLGTLSSTQVAVYSGTCASLTLVDCNADEPSCGSDYDNTNYTLTGLTSGDTYFVVVDGEYGDIGTFNITISDHSVGLPVVFGQDCGVDNAIPVCNTQFSVGDPGFQAVGNHCDFDGSNNCTGGERGSVWYHIEIGSNGVLGFTLVPNDYNASGSTGNETDYDFLLFKMAGSGAVTCEEIADGTAAPVRCDFSYLGITGMNGSSDDIAPSPYSPDYDYAFVSELNVSTGDEYFLVIQNYSNSTSGFDIDFGSTPITIPGGVPTELTWTGGANNTDWYEPLNWGDCAYYPNENIDANIIAASGYQPIIDATDPNISGQNARAKSLTISSGANLTINAGQTLEIYGNYDNTGILNANITSTVLFTGSDNQTLDGSLQGSSAFNNFTVTKSGGYVKSLQDIEIKGDFLTTSSTSVYKSSNKHVKVGGNFTLNTPSTYTNFTSSGILEFNGSLAQIYTPNGILALHDVIINNTSTGLTLNSNLKISTTGSLLLTLGIIHTGGHRVDVRNTNSSAINIGNTDSYIDGELRAYITNNSSLYNFPIGDNNQYTLAQLQNHSLSGTSYLTANFYDTFTSTGSLDANNAIDFGTPYVNLSTGGMWEIIANSQPTSGKYDIFLSFDDGGGVDAFTDLSDNQFGVLKRDHTSNSAADWYGESVGTINTNGGQGRMLSDGYASRYGISLFSDFALGTVDYPLAIELLSFNAKCDKGNAVITWEVASELNSSYYTIMKSKNAKDFVEIVNLMVKAGESFPKTYSFVDKDIELGMPTYYKLSEFDLDGKESNFKIVALDCKNQNNYYINAYQQSQNRASIHLQIPKGRYQLEVYDNTGKKLISKELNMYKDVQDTDLKKDLFTNGLYLIIVKNKNNKYSTKLIMN